MNPNNQTCPKCGGDLETAKSCADPEGIRKDYRCTVCNRLYGCTKAGIFLISSEAPASELDVKYVLVKERNPDTREVKTRLKRVETFCKCGHSRTQHSRAPYPPQCGVLDCECLTFSPTVAYGPKVPNDVPLWICPVCGTGCGAAIYYCDGPDEPHEPVFLAKLYADVLHRMQGLEK